MKVIKVLDPDHQLNFIEFCLANVGEEKIFVLFEVSNYHVIRCNYAAAFVKQVIHEACKNMLYNEKTAQTIKQLSLEKEKIDIFESSVEEFLKHADYLSKKFPNSQRFIKKLYFYKAEHNEKAHDDTVFFEKLQKHLKPCNNSLVLVQIHSAITMHPSEDQMIFLDYEKLDEVFGANKLARQRNWGFNKIGHVFGLMDHEEFLRVSYLQSYETLVHANYFRSFPFSIATAIMTEPPKKKQKRRKSS